MVHENEPSTAFHHHPSIPLSNRTIMQFSIVAAPICIQVVPPFVLQSVSAHNAYIRSVCRRSVNNAIKVVFDSIRLPFCKPQTHRLFSLSFSVDCDGMGHSVTQFYLSVSVLNGSSCIVCALNNGILYTNCAYNNVKFAQLVQQSMATHLSLSLSVSVPAGRASCQVYRTIEDAI